MTRLAPVALAMLALVVALGGVARADPRVDLGRCLAFDTGVLDRAIARELPPAAPPGPFGSAVVIVECPDLRTVQLHVEPLPAAGPIARTLDLGEVPADLRLKLLALAVAELYQVAAAAPPAPPPPKVTYVTPSPGAPPLGTVSHMSPLAPAPAPAAARAWSVAPHVALRIYPATPRPLAEVGGELTLPWLRVGVRGALGQTDAPLGTIRPWLLTATVARPLWCGGARTSACALVRVEGGAAHAGATAASTAAIARDATAPYAQATLAGEVAHRFAGWSGVASAEAGWAQGLVARAGGVDRVDLSGVVVVAAVGARW